MIAVTREMEMKTLEQHFADWEASAFGYGYGSGEEYVLTALKAFMENMPEERYDFRELEQRLTPAVTWLLINKLCLDGNIEYGTSPRFGWLTTTGSALARFMKDRTVEQLVAATDQGDDYIHCFTDYCNCDDGDCRASNPFWQVKTNLLA